MHLNITSLNCIKKTSINFVLYCIKYMCQLHELIYRIHIQVHNWIDICSASAANYLLAFISQDLKTKSRHTFLVQIIYSLIWDYYRNYGNNMHGSKNNLIMLCPNRFCYKSLRISNYVLFLIHIFTMPKYFG